MKKLLAKLKENKIKKLLVLIMLILMGVAGVAVALITKETGTEISFSPSRCFFPAFLHLYCPGCGGTRAVRFLLKGELVSSFLAHPLIPYLLFIYLQCLGMSVYDVFIDKSGKWHVKVFMWQIWGILVIVLGTFLVRNLLMLAFGIDFLGECVSFWNPIIPIN